MVMKSKIPYLLKLILGQWEGGNLLQLDFKINKGLFANMRHQVFFNQRDIQNIEKI